MLTTEARINTERPGRYLVQLCQHAAKIAGSHGSSQPSHGHGEAAGRGVVEVHAEWSETNGTLIFDSSGECTLQAEPDALVLRIEAGDEANLRQIRNILSADLERIGRRDDLDVRWT